MTLIRHIYGGNTSINRLLTCKTTMKNNSPQAISTFNRPMTMTQPPNWPNKLTMTNTVAKNCNGKNGEWSWNDNHSIGISVVYTFPHPQLISMYSLCSFHWKYIRNPSSRNVAIKHSRARVGRTYLPFLITCKMNTLELVMSDVDTVNGWVLVLI